VVSWIAADSVLLLVRDWSRIDRRVRVIESCLQVGERGEEMEVKTSSGYRENDVCLNRGQGLVGVVKK
jgi:hypothetical protein